MFQHSDAKNIFNRYEQYLFQARMPRQFWPYVVSKLQFLDFEIQRQVDGSKKAKKILSLTADQQQAYWTNLVHLVKTASLTGRDVQCQSVVFCSENLKDAQFAVFSFMHWMLQLRARDYKVEVWRTIELSKLMQLSDSLDIPDVLIMPALISSMSSNDNAILAELFCSSYRIFAATALSPQKFYDRFHYVPTYAFYLDELTLTKAL